MFQIHSTSSNTKRNTDIIETHARRKKREIDYSQNKIKKHNRIDINITQMIVGKQWVKNWRQND